MTLPTKIPLELLAPARNLETGKLAIAHGADAVYIGASDFGARAAVGNSLSDIRELVAYARIFGARVHVTINTLLEDQEVEKAYLLIDQLYEAGVDALIIQDMALCDMRRLPPVELHASTQTHNYSAERIRFLTEAGFDRIILARECSIEQIEHIHKVTDVPLEAFVHGALCVSFSGQCYMSAAICSRSANRGVCAQPCRHSYDLVNVEGKALVQDQYLLSLKDNCQLNNLEALIQAGVSSFKIEGRLKESDYVKNVVAAYRQKLDCFIDAHPEYVRASEGLTKFSFTPNLNATFNRGYTEYFAHGRTREMSSPMTPKSQGQYIGTIEKVLTPKKIMVRNSSGLRMSSGDGCIFTDAVRFKGGASLNHISEDIWVLSEEMSLAQGDKVYRNYDHQFQKKLQATDTSERKIFVDLHISRIEGEQICLRLEDEKGNAGSLILGQSEWGEVPRQAATAEQNFRTAFAKMGSSPFALRNIAFPAEGVRFVSMSTLNAWRRMLCERLLEQRHMQQERERGAERQKLTTKRTRLPQRKLKRSPEIKQDFRDNILNAKSRQFYVDKAGTTPAWGFESPLRAEALVPHMTCRYCIRFEQGACPHQLSLLKADEAVKIRAEWKEPMYLRSRAHKLRLEFQCKECEMQVFLEK